MLAILMGIARLFTGCSGSTLFYPYGYSVHGNKVFYKNAFPGPTFEIAGAHAKTFKTIISPIKADATFSTGYAVDKNRVYYAGNALPGSDGSSFAMLNSDFSTDKNQCYYHGSIIPQADPASFLPRDEIYSTDKNNVYKRDVLMDNDASVFETFDSSTVVHTAHAVSLFSYILPLQPGAVFKYLGLNYYAIDGQVYWLDKPVPGATATSFKAFDDFFWTSGKHVYYRELVIENADPATFKLLPSPYTKDAKHIFFFEKTIEGADVKTFEILNTKFQCARDKQTMYHEEKRIQNVTAEDMTNKKECIQCNERAVYFAEK